jgi:hypothetical protein
MMRLGEYRSSQSCWDPDLGVMVYMIPILARPGFQLG